ncbi:hypothetical protein Agau_C100837 [Agrobacterium tumefaciens F2]|nr:hypothetical protein Agau_C100837 [Agrobacterium tumefaciens F2]
MNRTARLAERIVRRRISAGAMSRGAIIPRCLQSRGSV